MDGNTLWKNGGTAVAILDGAHLPICNNTVTEHYGVPAHALTVYRGSGAGHVEDVIVAGNTVENCLFALTLAEVDDLVVAYNTLSTQEGLYTVTVPCATGSISSTTFCVAHPRGPARP